MNKNRYMTIVISIVLTIAIFIVDLQTPLGYADWLLYFIPFFLAAQALNRRYVLLLTSMITLLILASNFLSPPGGSPARAATNSAMGIFVLWWLSFIIVKRERAEKALAQSYRESEQRVKDRTEELRKANASLTSEIAERARAEQELAQAVQRLSAHMDNSPLAVVEFDPHFRVTRWSKEAERMFGWSAEEIVGRAIAEIRWVYDEDVDSVQRESAGLLNGERPRSLNVNRNYRKDGSVIHCEWYNSAIYDEQGRLLSVLSLVLDITERKRAEEALKAAHRELEHRAGELTAINKELEAFNYSISHDLRAPLRHIEGFVRVLLEEYSGALDEKGRDYLRRVSSGSQRMKDLVDALLSLSRCTRANLNRSKVNLSVMVKAAVAERRQSWPGRTVELVVAEGVTAEGDPTMLQVVINNLVWNSWKFTHKRPDAKIEFGTFECGTRNEEFGMKAQEMCEEGETVYFVRDNGAGFDKKYSDKLFTPFLRLHSDDDFPGLGIGLSIVQRIIHRHGGRIWAEGEIDKGATFYVTLH